MTSATLAPEAGSTDIAHRRRPSGQMAWLLTALSLLCLSMLASVAFGARWVPFGEVFEALTSSPDGIAQIAVRERVPRTVLAVLVGGALGMGGAVLQGVTRNPLAGPGILGIQAGAALAVVTGITFFGLESPSTWVWLAIVGSGLAAAFVWGIGSLGFGGPTPLKLALAGAATWAAASSLTSAILLPRLDVLDRFRFWQIGGVGGAEWSRMVQVLPFLLVGVTACLVVASSLNTLALGDDVAAGLGEPVARTRAIGAVGAIVLCGAATAVAGPIAFVGLVVPHLCRLLVGVDHRWLLPISAVAGAALLTLADVVGRVVARPAEVDVGIVTAFVGAPVFIWVVRRQKVAAL